MSGTFRVITPGTYEKIGSKVAFLVTRLDTYHNS